MIKSSPRATLGWSPAMDSVPDLTSLTTPEDTTVMMILPGTLLLRDFREGKSCSVGEWATGTDQTGRLSLHSAVLQGQVHRGK